MEGLNDYLFPYVTSQIISIVLLIIAWKHTKWARILFALIFFLSAWVNMYSGIVKPDVYLKYGEMATPLYKDFIYGWFSRYNHLLIPFIAVCQFLIAVGMLLKGRLVKLACIGIILFLLSIAPLMVGAAFPFSITVSIAAYLVYRKKDLNYLWKKGFNNKQ